MSIALVGLASAVVGALIAGVAAHYRDRSNRESARELKELENRNAAELKEREIEAQRADRLLDSRKEAYAEMIEVTSVIGSEKYEIQDLARALAKVKLVSGSSVTVAAAESLYTASRAARKMAVDAKREGKEVSSLPDTVAAIKWARATNGAFIDAAKHELYGDAPGDD